MADTRRLSKAGRFLRNAAQEHECKAGDYKRAHERIPPQYVSIALILYLLKLVEVVDLLDFLQPSVMGNLDRSKRNPFERLNQVG
jgi:hypothetical protein